MLWKLNKQQKIFPTVCTRDGNFKEKVGSGSVRVRLGQSSGSVRFGTPFQKEGSGSVDQSSGSVRVRCFS